LELRMFPFLRFYLRVITGLERNLKKVLYSISGKKFPPLFKQNPSNVREEVP